MKKSYYISKIENKSSIKIAKLNENLNVTKDFKEMKMSIKNYFNTEKIHV